MIGQIQDIDVKLLRVFRTVVCHGGLSAAQSELNASLPTISSQIKQLEERLGVRLCERGNQGFSVTVQGEALLRSSEVLFAAFDDFRNDLAELVRLPMGEARLGVIDNLTNNPVCRIHSALADLYENMPGAGINFYIGPPNELEGQVLAGTLDMAIGLFPRRLATIEYVSLFQETQALYCAPGHPLFEMPDSAIDQIALSQAAYASWSYLEPYVCATITTKFDVITGTAFMEGLVSLIRSGRYMGYLPCHFARSWVASGELRAILPDHMGREVSVELISRRGRKLKRVAASLHYMLRCAHAVV